MPVGQLTYTWDCDKSRSFSKPTLPNLFKFWRNTKLKEEENYGLGMIAKKTK